MLISFGHIKKPFLDIQNIPDFATLNTLFFDVLAKPIKERNTSIIPSGLEQIPYLNSSLFDKTDLEKDDTKDAPNKQIKFLKTKPLALYGNSILKKEKYTQNQALPLLEYLFAFLHAYSFTTTSKDIKENIKTNFDKLINSSVFGLVFEKFNGYKEGSFYTPSQVTNHMCKESIQKILITKFNTAKNWQCKSLVDLKNKIGQSEEDIKEANKIFYSISICDPSVGSGHFLVSALNELVYLKYELGLLCNQEYERLKDIKLSIKADEIFVIDFEGNSIEYQMPTHDRIQSHEIQKALFDTKKAIIENCLFGVDINPNSCEITKLRLWIELLKYSYYYDIPNKLLQTLPNIDINIKCGNSLISNIDLYITKDSLQKTLKDKFNDSAVLKGIGDSSYQAGIIEDLGKFKHHFQIYKDAINAYKNEKNKDLKQLDKQKISESGEFLKNIFIKTNPIVFAFRNELAYYASNYGYEGFSIKDTDKIDLDQTNLKKLENYISAFDFHKTIDIPKIGEYRGANYTKLQNLIKLMKEYEELHLAKTFEWRLEFPEVLDENGDFIGFDLIIGNPPYIRQEKIKDLKPHLSKRFEIYNSSSDIYTYFYEQGYKLLTDNGILSFITSNKYARTAYGEKLREFILNKTTLLKYTELNRIKVFDNATVDTSILSFVNSSPPKDYYFLYANQQVIEPQNIASTPTLDIPISTLSKKSFIFSDSFNHSLKQKIERLSTPLKKWNIDINRGILTGYNEAFIIDTNKRDEILQACDNTSNSIIETMIEDEKYGIITKKLNEKERTQQIIRPILRGRDIKKYSHQWAGKWIIGTHNGYEELLTKIKISPIDIEEYPALKAHLDKYQKQITKRQDMGHTPYNLRNCAYLSHFNKNKIIYSEIARSPQFYLDRDKLYPEATSYIMTGKHLEFLLGVLNSKPIAFIFKSFFAGGGLGDKSYRYNKTFLEQLPIPKITSQNKPLVNQITQIAKEILSLKAQNPATDTTSQEDAIDTLVYNLYSLTPDEIALIKSQMP